MKTIYWILIIVGAAILTVVATYLIQKQITKSSSDKRIMDNLRRSLGVVGVDYPAPRGYWDTHGCTGTIVNDICPPPREVYDKVLA